MCDNLAFGGSPLAFSIVDFYSDALSYDYLPLREMPRPEFYLGWDKDDSEDIEGRLEGISTADFARALADDAETQAQKGKHWTAFTPLKDDTPYPSYLKFPSKK